MEKPVENKLRSTVNHSGNSDVDLNLKIEIDTKAIAYGMLCSLFAKGDLTELELEKAIRKLDNLIERDRNKKRNINYYDSRPKSFNFSEQLHRKRWI
ncbi:hypothetical protein ACE38V_19980 [Cytobacillus sp. Hz8]|uniref:hypothetical protein n=1 Tax=Cytobacillus sp. Hz8 TaxID=3347168 RepID=UPI0035E36DC1